MVDTTASRSTHKWVKGRYLAERHELEARCKEWKIPVSRNIAVAGRMVQPMVLNRSKPSFTNC